MFFMLGITDGKKEIPYTGGMHLCAACGAYTSYTVVMTYMCLSLFFIPICKWNRMYYVKASCCESLFFLDGEKGKAIARGESIPIEDADLRPVQKVKRCPDCGFRTKEDFAYCPKCGKEF